MMRGTVGGAGICHFQSLFSVVCEQKSWRDSIVLNTIHFFKGTGTHIEQEKAFEALWGPQPSTAPSAQRGSSGSARAADAKQLDCRCSGRRCMCGLKNERNWN
jgi:hypothetical protein